MQVPLKPISSTNRLVRSETVLSRIPWSSDGTEDQAQGEVDKSRERSVATAVEPTSLKNASSDISHPFSELVLKGRASAQV